MGTVISPTVGRVVWFWNVGMRADSQPHAAIVSHVYNERMVNLACFDASGTQYAQTSVKLLQEGDPTLFAVGGACLEPHAQWMPYQIGQAKKHEAAAA